MPPPARTAPPPAQPATQAAPAKSSGSSKTLLVVLGVVLGLFLLVVVGVWVAFHMVVSKVRALAGGDAQTSEQTQAGSSAETRQGAQVTGNVIGSILGTDAKGKSDIGKALQNMAQAGQQIEQHQKATGNPNGVPDAQDTQQAVQAAGGVLGALAGSMGGAHRHDPVAFQTLVAMLPTSLPGLQAGVPKGEADAAMGLKTTGAEVQFTGADNASVTVSIKDAAAVSGLAGIAEMANSQESQQGDSYEKNENLGGYRVHEKWDAQNKQGELSLIVGKRFGVHVSGYHADMETMKAALAQIDLGKLESMKEANPQAQ